MSGRLSNRDGAVLICPDKFKHSISAAAAARSLARGVRTVRPHADIIELPIADGGEGTVEAALSAGFDPVSTIVEGPTGEPVRAVYAQRGATAVVEMASASGLAVLPHGVPQPDRASSYGTGQLIAAALDAGCRRIILGIGGSASTDGGAGMIQALGGEVLTEDGAECERGGGALTSAAAVDFSHMHPGLATAQIQIACDVDNPLLGEAGAAQVYGPQKGADPAQAHALDRALERWARLVTAYLGEDFSQHPGSGAAGGVGFGARAVLGAELSPGAEVIFGIIGWADLLKRASLIITGEGRLDQQTLHGKGPARVAAAGHAAHVPVVAVAGESTLTETEIERLGFVRVYSLADLEPDVETSMKVADVLLEQTGRTVARMHL